MEKGKSRPEENEKGKGEVRAPKKKKEGMEKCVYFKIKV